MWRHFYKFILLDIFQCLFQTELDGRREKNLLIRTGSTDVGKLLRFADIYIKVALARMFTYHLAGVNLLTGLHEEATAVQQLFIEYAFASPVSSDTSEPLLRCSISPLKG